MESTQLCAYCRNPAAGDSEQPFTDTRPELQRFVVNNEPPLDSEVRSLLDIIAATSFHISQVDKEIAKHTATLRELASKRHALQKCMNDCRAITSAMRRMPNEIWAEIFTFARDDEWNNDIKLTLDPVSVPWKVSRVCSTWRTCAIAHSGLWTSVFLDLQPKAGRKHDLLQLYLSRAGDRLLSDVIMGADYNATLDVSNPILQTILLTSPRWKRLELVMPATWYHAFDGLRGRLPFLETLNLIDNTTEEAPLHPQFRMFELAPMLKSVHGLADFTARFALPWSQLAEYRSYNNEQPSSNLSNMRILETAPIEEISMSCRLASAVSPLRIETLLRLTLQATDGGIDQLLGSLTIPSLTELMLEGQFRANVVTSFLQRSRCPIEHLSLESTSLAEGDLVDMLSTMNSSKLREINLECSAIIGNQLLNQLSPKPDQDLWLPRLKTMHFTGLCLNAEIIRMMYERRDLVIFTASVPEKV
ncbi:hypothetical protein C8J56DRAFT_1024556 [Mycena floridula]|nr:hypothetical protein C8J56DRAFT_1024556 [Mycena floridula]